MAAPPHIKPLRQVRVSLTTALRRELP